MATIQASETDSEFLSAPRIGVLIVNTSNQEPRGIPVWFEWDGSTIAFFSAHDSSKVSYLSAGQPVSFVVSNTADESSLWFAFDGTAEVHDSGALELAERLAHRYWSMEEDEHKSLLASWREHADALCRVVITPTRIRTGS
ncbi:MAG: pyridoxamine 5'-phosphate oxidase family protein [Pseudomonadales bacterium]|nr:pyridoxamine 5'-phosphate oxidase family protein [Pseudomonadales bacterium]